jgi:hypothetical protein
LIVPLSFLLLWIALILTVVASSMLEKSSSSKAAEDRARTIRILIVVEAVLLAAFLLSMTIAYFILFSPPLYTGASWLQFFAMVCVPDIVVCTALLLLVLFNYRKVASAKTSSVRLGSMSAKSSSSTLSSFNDPEEGIPQNYRV